MIRHTLKRAVWIGSGLAVLVVAPASIGGATRTEKQPARTGGHSPIHITFVIHFDPLPAPDGQVPRWAYEAERDNLAWLADYLERLEQTKGKEFVPRLTLEIAGDHAEWYLEDEEGLRLLRRLYRKGIHSFGTHFHRNYHAGRHLWYDVPPSPQACRRVTYDHITGVDKLIGKIIGSDDPRAIRKVNRTITGHLLDQRLAEQMGFDVLTGGRNEAMNLFFDHDVYNPFRPAMGWNLAEDLNSRWLLIPQAPVLGAIGEHAPLPPAVPEEYTRGMRRMIWQDLSLPAMKRKFLHLYLEWLSSAIRNPQPAAGKVWVFGWHEHTNDLFPNDAPGRFRRKVRFRPEMRFRRKMRGAVVEFVEWLNTNFIRKRTAGGLVAKYASTDEVRDEFLAWERACPGQSSFNYPVPVRDWEKYPYQLKGLARELMYAHHEEEITTFKDKGVHAHKFARADGRNWMLRDGKVVCNGATKDIYLLWSASGEVTIDFSSVVKGTARRVEGRSGKEAMMDAQNLTVPEEPIVVEAAESQVCGEANQPTRCRRHDVADMMSATRCRRRPQHAMNGAAPDPIIIQFRLNVNYFADEAEARQNCRNLRRHLELFKQAGVKASYWFTGLAAEQVQRLDPEFIRLLNQAGMTVAHHGANRPPQPMPIARVRGENWEEDVQAIMDYESHALDPRTGQLDKTRVGGLKQMQQTFGNRIKATGRFYQASILYVTKQFGCRAMVGLKDNTGARTNAGWFLGMMGMPDARVIGPEMLRRAVAEQFDAFRFIEDFTAGSKPIHGRLADGADIVSADIVSAKSPDCKPVEVQSLAVLIHDTDFLRGPPASRQRLWQTYASLVRRTAQHPRLKVMTHEEILDQIADDRTKTVSHDAVLKAAEAITASPTAPPEYVDLDGDYLSLADAFQAFAQSLRAYAETGKLPESVRVIDLLGPTEAYHSELPPVMAAVALPGATGEAVVDAARQICAEMTDRVPPHVSVGGLKLNPAEFLLAMAQTVTAIAHTGKPLPLSLHAVDLLPHGVRENRLADPLTKLQFWTFKPERWRQKAKGERERER